LILSLCYSGKSTAQPVYTIPWAAQQPQWVFPIWFEDGLGRRDTVYICYDPLALTSPHQDSLFGSYAMNYDTTDFNMGKLLNSSPCTVQPCPIRKVYVSSNAGHKLLEYFVFYSGNKIKYPLKVYYDVSVLNSQALPWIPPGFSSHKAQAYGLFYDEFTYFSTPSFCSTSQYVLMSDSVSPYWFFNYACLAKDSIIWNSSLHNYGYASVTFNVEKWTGWPTGGVGIDEKNTKDLKYTFINNIIFINQPLEYIKLYDIAGKKVYEDFKIYNSAEINLYSFQNAMYIIETKTKTGLPEKSKILICK
jgi:hypothetical protein